MKVLHNGKWLEFCPIIRPIVGIEQLDKRPFEDLEEEVYGKAIYAIVGYQPVWIYLTVKKKDISVD